MVDILESLTIANRLKEETRAEYINTPESFLAHLRKLKWTQKMIDELSNMLKTAPKVQNAHKNKDKKASAAADFEILRNFYSKVSQTPAEYGISGFDFSEPDKKQLYDSVMSGKQLFGFIKYLVPVVPMQLPATTPGTAVTEQLPKENTPALTDDAKQIIAADQDSNDETLNNETPEDEKVAYTGQFLIWPLNPLLPGIKDEFDKVVEAIEKYKGYTVVVTSLNKGGDGQFDIGSFNQFKHHKAGVSFGTAEKDSFPVTSWKTLAKYIIDNQSDSKITESHTKLDISLKLLNEGDSNLVDTKTAQFGNSSIKTSIGDRKFSKNIHIVCSPEMKTSMEKDGFFDLLKPLGIDEKNCIIPDPDLSTPKTIEAGKIIFKTFLEYINGKKTGSAAAQDTSDTLTSQKMNESTSLKEADSQTYDWSWESLKVNTGAKEYIKGLYDSVKAIKDGLDDGGNPSMASRVLKQVATEVGKEWGAALTDGADFMMQGLGLGWMMPLIKAGIETQRKEAPNKEFEGPEALVRSEEFKSLTAYFGDPKAFIEKGTN